MFEAFDDISHEASTVADVSLVAAGFFWRETGFANAHVTIDADDNERVGAC